MIRLSGSLSCGRILLESLHYETCEPGCLFRVGECYHNMDTMFPWSRAAASHASTNALCPRLCLERNNSRAPTKP